MSIRRKIDEGPPCERRPYDVRIEMMDFDSVQGFRLLEELVRESSPPATLEEICDRGAVVTAKALEASGGVVLLWESDQSTGLECAWGTPLGVRDSPEVAATRKDGRILETGTRDQVDHRLFIPIPGPEGRTMGVVVVDRPRCWTDAARSFAQVAAQAMASSLQSAQRLLTSQGEGVLLVQRNVELETLRELADALHEQHTEEEALQVALDVVLRKLGLRSGWIFWGDSGRQDLRLAASRGIDEGFVSRSREIGIGSCLCRDVFETGRLRFARNTTDCPRLPDLVCGSEPMTHACIPLKFERGVMGVMNIANRPHHLFTPAELSFLETVGSHVCLAVDKVRIARAENRSNAEARALASLARAIGGSLELERVLAAVGDYARELLSVDRCGIFLGSDPSSLQFAYSAGAPFEGLQVGEPVDFVALEAKGIVRALSEGRTLVVQHSSQDSRVNSKLAERWDMGSGMLVPLSTRDGLEGILVAGRSSSSIWTQEEVALGDTLARHAAVAIENAHLFRKVQEALTHLQQAQSGIVRAERLAAIGTLAASLAHEVRNPLNSIHLQLVLLGRRIGQLADDPRRNLSALVDTAQQEITRLDGLVEDFLSLSSMDRLTRRPVNLNEVVRDVILLMGPEARGKDITILEDFDGGVGPVLIDSEKIKQVLINLVRNSIEAMPGGGVLTVSTHSEGNDVRLLIGDTGMGIPPGVDVFDFFMTTKSGGTGLGLPIARRIVEAHGGSLAYESEPGTGTVFTVALRSDRES